VTVSDEQGGSGAKAVHYRIDGGAEQVLATTGDPGRATISMPDGRHSLEYWGEDQGGNQEATHHTLSVNSDRANHCVPVIVTQKSCTDNRSFKFKLHHGPRARVVRLRVYVNGKLNVSKHGRSIRTFTLSKLSLGNFTVKIIAKQSSGSTLTSVRKYAGCTKLKSTTRAHHARTRRHHG
jgi:hypothetical protein